MNVTIGMTFSDRDYFNVPLIIEQIKETVKCDYEIITIDNRDIYKNEPLLFEPTYSFGFNAYQFKARGKIIELANMDYIWFVDGDDYVLGLEDNNYDEDIIIYSYEGELPIPYEPCILSKEDIFDDGYNKYGNMLWNKIIKKELFNGLSAYSNNINGKVALEDAGHYLYAANNARSIRVLDDIIYKKNEGLSDKRSITEISTIKEIILGYQESLDFIRSFIKNDTFINEKVIKPQCMYYLGKIFYENSNIELMCETVKIIEKYFEYDVMNECFYNLVTNFISKNEYITIKRELENYYKKEIVKYITYQEGYYDEIENKMKTKDKKWRVQIYFSEDFREDGSLNIKEDLNG